MSVFLLLCFISMLYREAEKECLYKYREKTHMQETEEAEHEKQFNDTFPTFEEVKFFVYVS